LGSPRELQTFELVRQGKPVPMTVEKTRDGPVHRWRIRGRLRFERSGWLAVRGTGELKQALLQEAGVRQHALAHTSPIRIIVDGQPIASRPAADFLIEQIENQTAIYRASGQYATPADRAHVLALFDEALRRVRSARRAAMPGSE
jgi:hypothetical protein